MSSQDVFCEQLRRARKELGYTQEQTAEAVSISPRWYQRIEGGMGRPSHLVILRLFLLFNIEPDAFSFEEPKPPEKKASAQAAPPPAPKPDFAAEVKSSFGMFLQAHQTEFWFGILQNVVGALLAEALLALLLLLLS